MAVAMVQYIRSAFGERLKTVQFMDEETTAMAKKKLEVRTLTLTVALTITVIKGSMFEN